MSKRILLIAYSYPPLSDAQSIRWYFLSKGLVELGYEIDVLTIDLPKNVGNFPFEIPNNIRQFRSFPGLIEGISFKLKSKIGVDTKNNKNLRKRSSFRLLKGGYWLIRRILNSLLVGGIQTEWLPFALNYLRKIDLERYDLVITSQEPVVDSLVGLILKYLRPEVPWIADMGDTFSAPYYPNWRRRLDWWFEKLIVNKADRVILTNNYALKDLLNRVGSFDTEKFFILRQGFPRKLLDLSNRKRKKNKIFTLVFTGTFYRDFRNPSELIKALSEVNFDYKLIIAGRNEGFLKDFEIIKDKVEFLGFVSYSESLKLQQEADVLIHLSNKQSIQVPGKFFEYLGARKPILSIVYTKEDETARLTEELGAGIVCFNSADSIRSAVTKLYNLWKTDTLENFFSVDRKVLEEFTWESNAKKLGRLIEEVS